jgi:hypothetical protein
VTAPYVRMFGFGILLLASWAGWGAAIERLLLGRAAADRALHTGWGLAFTIVVGGVLNGAHVIGPTAIHLFLIAGLGLLLWDCGRRRRRIGFALRRRIRRLRHDRLLALAAVLVAALLVGVYAANVCSTSYNAYDDLQGYFVFPAKMIQTGALGPDPYSERRLVSLGGMSFLHSIILSVADSRYFQLVDPGVSLPLGVALLLGVARDARAGPWAALLTLLLFLAVPRPWANTTSVVTGLVLFLTLFRTLAREGPRVRPSVPAAVLVALTASGLCGLKSTHVPACALMILVAYLVRGRRSRARGALFGELLLAGGLTLAFLAPWMASMYQSNGTLLYPLLGRGFHGSAYGTFWQPYGGLTFAAAGGLVMSALTDLRTAPALILGGGLLARGRCGAGGGAVVAFLLATLASLVALVAALGPTSAYRYAWAFLYPAILTLLLYSGSGTTAERPPRGRLALAAAPVLLAVGTLLLARYGDPTRTLWRQLGSIVGGVRESQAAGFKRWFGRRYASMQRAVPEGAVLLTRLEYPFVLDFRRNTVFIVDYPGGSSPPPGMPFFSGGERLAEYLCARSVRYVAYSYRTEAAFTREAFGYRLGFGPGTDPWSRAQARHTLDFQANLAELGQDRLRIYDDGDVFVLDLDRSRAGDRLHCTAS